jgi:membrane protease subunit HflK
VLKDSNKVIVDQNGQGIVPYLPLSEITKQQRKPEGTK